MLSYKVKNRTEFLKKLNHVIRDKYLRQKYVSKCHETSNCCQKHLDIFLLENHIGLYCSECDFFHDHIPFLGLKFWRAKKYAT